MCALTWDLNRSKKRYEFLKFVKNDRFFGHNFQIFKFFKNFFVALEGHTGCLEFLLKEFFSSTKYMVSMIFFRFSPFFRAHNLENSSLKFVKDEPNFFCYSTTCMHSLIMQYEPKKFFDLDEDAFPKWDSVTPLIV